MSDPRDEYTASLNALNEAEAQVEEIAELFSKLSNEFRTRNGKSGVQVQGFPIEPGGIGFLPSAIDPSNIPDAQRVGEALVVYHDAVRRLRTAWGAMPPEQQTGMKEPPYGIL